jgi:NADH-quinone oxidoreductase subunit J
MVTFFLAIMVVFAANAVYAILFLIGTFLMVGFTFILVGAEYLGLVLMIVYVGAIAILFLFVLMLLDLRNLIHQRMSLTEMVLYIAAIILTTEYILYTFDFGPFYLFNTSLELFLEVLGNNVLFIDPLLSISPTLFNLYFYYVGGCGLILLFVMLGVVLLLADSPVSLYTATGLDQSKYLANPHLVVKLGIKKNPLK